MKSFPTDEVWLCYLNIDLVLQNEIYHTEILDQISESLTIRIFHELNVTCTALLMLTYNYLNVGKYCK